MGLFPNIFDIVSIAVIFTAKGGWVLFVLGMAYMMYRLYRLEIEHQFIHAQDWVFLNVKISKTNPTSTLSVENIFSQLHALHVGLTPAQVYVEGRIQLWYSFEMISMGGKISYIIRVPKHTRHVVESAFYSSYPDAEIAEVGDYMENFKYDPDVEGPYDIWGTEWKLNTDHFVPIKTYKDFEHPSAEEKIVDPLSGVFEALSKFQPHEFFGVQIITQPLADDEWQPQGELYVKKLTGEEVPHERKLSDILLAPFALLSHTTVTQALKGGAHGAHGHGNEQENKPRNNWLSMTEAEKQRVTLVESKIGKPGYKTKIRMLYIAPKDKMDNSKKSLVSGMYRPLGSVMTNKPRPDVSKTWTGVDYLISPGLEKPYLDWLLKRKKRFIFRGYKRRDIHIGLPMFVLNTEELATMFHFPITSETKAMPASVEQTMSKKAQPPVNLPVGEI